MTNISKKKLSRDTQEHLFAQFISLFSASNRKQHADLFSALFSESEKTMLIKRLAVVLLLLEEYSTYRIAKTLMVSDSTVRSIQLQYKAGKYDAILSNVQKEKFDKREFLKTVEVLLRGGLPPRGRGRWKWLYENH